MVLRAARGAGQLKKLGRGSDIGDGEPREWIVRSMYTDRSRVVGDGPGDRRGWTNVSGKRLNGFGGWKIKIANQCIAWRVPLQMQSSGGGSSSSRGGGSSDTLVHMSGRFNRHEMPLHNRRESETVSRDTRHDEPAI